MFDVATPLGYPDHDSDFGLTLALWNVPGGPFLFLPVLGTTNPRDAVGYGANYALDPFISFFQSAPRIALLPLLIIWLGIGIWSKIAVIYLGAFFPIVINTVSGVRNLDPALIKAARSFGASDAQIFRTLALPG